MKNVPLKRYAMIFTAFMAMSCNYTVSGKEKHHDVPSPNLLDGPLVIFRGKLVAKGEVFRLSVSRWNEGVSTGEGEGLLIDTTTWKYQPLVLDSYGQIYQWNQDLVLVPTDEYPKSSYIAKRSAGSGTDRMPGPDKLLLVTADYKIYLEELDNTWSTISKGVYDLSLQFATFNSRSLCGIGLDSFLYCWNFPLGGEVVFFHPTPIVGVILSEYYLCYLDEMGIATCHRISENREIDPHGFSLKNQTTPLAQISFRMPHGTGMVRILGLTQSGDILFWDENDQEPSVVSRGKKMARIEEYPETWEFFSIDENGVTYIVDHIMGDSSAVGTVEY
ncbi:hypothetical protein KKF84_19800 [Myxococcota bacterium]|nr:hypothetical protein [Myxococcota bacterium]